MLLKKDKWWVWLISTLFGGFVAYFLLGFLLDVYNKDAWYAKWQNWVLSLILFVFPFFIMFVVFDLVVTSKICAKLEVPGTEIYLSPYIWLFLLIVPIIGWILLMVLIVYLKIWIVVMLYRGYGEKYEKESV